MGPRSIDTGCQRRSLVFCSTAGLTQLIGHLPSSTSASSRPTWRLRAGSKRADADAVCALMLNTVSCTATFVQDAGVAALTGDDTPVQAMRDEFLRRREILVDGLNRIPGVTCKLPGGAFYVFPNVSAIDADDIKLANHILDVGNVAVLGGSTFGPNGKGFIRMSYANSEENLREALSRIKTALASYRR